MNILEWDHHVAVIGEVGQAHDGSLGTAHAYIDAIADAVKSLTRAVTPRRVTWIRTAIRRSEPCAGCQKAVATDWAQSLEMPGARVAVADYRPAWWPYKHPAAHPPGGPGSRAGLR